MEKQEQLTYKVLEVALLAGKIMLRCGAETSRVEDTMSRVAEACGVYDTHSFVTPTGIIFSTDGDEPTKLIRIINRTTDLYKVTEVNRISRGIVAGDISIPDAFVELKALDKSTKHYPTWLQIVTAAILSGCFTIMFNGHWHDFIPAMITGGLGFSGLLIIHHYINTKFFAEFAAAFIVGLVSFLFVHYHLGHQIDKIIIGSVMPLVPGVLITNAVRDLLAGHLVSGISKGADASLTAVAIGSGIAVIFSIT